VSAVTELVERALHIVGRGLRCTFCGKGHREVQKLVANTCPPGIAPSTICNECVWQCVVVMGMKGTGATT
jgi:hypothetical protein